MSDQLERKRLRKQADALDILVEKREELEAAGRAYRAAILEAAAVGAPVSAIAEAAARSGPRIYQILKEEEGND